VELFSAEALNFEFPERRLRSQDLRAEKWRFFETLYLETLLAHLNLKFFETAIEKLVKWTGAKSSAAKSSALVHMLNDRGGRHLCLPLIALLILTR
jgi:hypothetical protein